jgi:hypothetical protein
MVNVLTRARIFSWLVDLLKASIYTMKSRGRQGGLATLKFNGQQIGMTYSARNAIFPNRRHSWSSVVKGAVLRGMAIGAEIPPKIATCPRRYGLSLNGGRPPSLKEGLWTVDPLDDKIFSPTQLIWLVNRGDVIFPDSEFTRTIKLGFQKQDIKNLQTTEITFVADGNDRVPTRLEELNARCTSNCFRIDPLHFVFD